MPKKNPMPSGRYDEAIARSGHACEAHRYGLSTPCDGALIVHHRKLRGMGGTSDPEIHALDNLAVLCGGPTGRDGHHGHVHDNPAESYESGLLVRRSNQP